MASNLRLQGDYLLPLEADSEVMSFLYRGEVYVFSKASEEVN